MRVSVQPYRHSYVEGKNSLLDTSSHSQIRHPWRSTMSCRLDPSRPRTNGRKVKARTRVRASRNPKTTKENQKDMAGLINDMISRSDHNLQKLVKVSTHYRQAKERMGKANSKRGSLRQAKVYDLMGTATSVVNMGTKQWIAAQLRSWNGRAENQLRQHCHHPPQRCSNNCSRCNHNPYLPHCVLCFQEMTNGLSDSFVRKRNTNLELKTPSSC